MLTEAGDQTIGLTLLQHEENIGLAIAPATTIDRIIFDNTVPEFSYPKPLIAWL
jgi:hypothetical protein